MVSNTRGHFILSAKLMSQAIIGAIGMWKVCFSQAVVTQWAGKIGCSDSVTTMGWENNRMVQVGVALYNAKFWQG